MGTCRQIGGMSLAALLVAAGLLTRPLALGAAQKIDLDDPLTVPRMSLADFTKLHERDAVLTVDVRSDLEYAGGRIPKALGVPLAETARRADDIRGRANGRPVVFYCSCPSEHSSAEAALVLYKTGVKDVRALVGGYQAWVRSGGLIER